MLASNSNINQVLRAHEIGITPYLPLATRFKRTFAAFIEIPVIIAQPVHASATSNPNNEVPMEVKVEADSSSDPINLDPVPGKASTSVPPVDINHSIDQVA